MTKINLILLLCLTLLLGACGKSAEEKAAEKQIEKATGGDADVDISKKGMKVTGKTEEGEFTMSSGDKTEVPKDFPPDVFIYRPSKTVMAMETPDGYSLHLTTQDSRK